MHRFQKVFTSLSTLECVQNVHSQGKCRLTWTLQQCWAPYDLEGHMLALSRNSINIAEQHYDGKLSQLSAEGHIYYIHWMLFEYSMDFVYSALSYLKHLCLTEKLFYAFSFFCFLFFILELIEFYQPCLAELQFPAFQN